MIQAPRTLKKQEDPTCPSTNSDTSTMNTQKARSSNLPKHWLLHGIGGSEQDIGRSQQGRHWSFRTRAG